MINDPNDPFDPNNRKKKTPSFLQTLLKEDTELYYKEDCPECGGEDCFIHMQEHLFEIPEDGFSEIMPVWVCSQCGFEALEDAELERVMSHSSKKKGEHYVKIEVFNGKQYKRILH